jgi:hypothetical protein
MLFLGEARPGGIAAVGDTAEGIFDGRCVEGGRIVVARPFFDVDVARVSRISDRFEQFVEARDADTVLGRSVSFAADIARIGDARLAGANVAHGEAMLPGVAEIVGAIADGLSRFEHVAQTSLGRHQGRLGSPVVIHRHAVPLLRVRLKTSSRIAELS